MGSRLPNACMAIAAATQQQQQIHRVVCVPEMPLPTLTPRAPTPPAISSKANNKPPMGAEKAQPTPEQKPNLTLQTLNPRPQQITAEMCVCVYMHLKFSSKI